MALFLPKSNQLVTRNIAGVCDWQHPGKMREEERETDEHITCAFLYCVPFENEATALRRKASRIGARGQQPERYALDGMCI